MFRDLINIRPAVIGIYITGVDAYDHVIVKERPFKILGAGLKPCPVIIGECVIWVVADHAVEITHRLQGISGADTGQPAVKYGK